MLLWRGRDVVHSCRETVLQRDRRLHGDVDDRDGAQLRLSDTRAVQEHVGRVDRRQSLVGSTDLQRHEGVCKLPLVATRSAVAVCQHLQATRDSWLQEASTGTRSA